MKEASPASTTCRFRYRGYQQNSGVREFAFEDVAEEKNTHPILVDVDVQLLLKHHVHFQDAPQLCLQYLQESSLPKIESNGVAMRIVVSDDVLAELQAKTEEATGTKRRRG
jgi:hypothetical protein